MDFLEIQSDPVIRHFPLIKNEYWNVFDFFRLDIFDGLSQIGTSPLALSKSDGFRIAGWDIERSSRSATSLLFGFRPIRKGLRLY